VSVGAFGTTELTFSGDIIQVGAFGGAVQVFDETNAITYTNIAGSGYAGDHDTWLFNGWDPIAGGVNNMAAPGPASGQPVILTLGSGTTPVSEKNLIQVVATGDVIVNGLFAFGSGAVAEEVILQDFVATAGGGVVDPEADAGGDAGGSEYVVLGRGHMTAGGKWGFMLAGDYQQNDGPPAGDVEWFISGGPEGLGETLLALGLNPEVSFADLSQAGARTRAPGTVYDLRMVVLDGAGAPIVQDTATLNVPEPTTMGLMIFGAAGMIARKRRRS